jgi:hypothetical protein
MLIDSSILADAEAESPVLARSNALATLHLVRA